MCNHGFQTQMSTHTQLFSLATLKPTHQPKWAANARGKKKEGRGTGDRFLFDSLSEFNVLP